MTKRLQEEINWKTSWRDYFAETMYPQEFCLKFERDGRRIPSDNIIPNRDAPDIHNYISIPHIHEDNDYILYFINNDFNLNRLRKLLIILMKERMNLYSHELDEGKQITNELEYNELLIEYCRKLIISCKNYLEKQTKNSTISLTL